MKTKRYFLCICLLFLLAYRPHAENHFSFALFTDLHLNPDNPIPAQDLAAAVRDVNGLDSIKFVLVTGDITENGDRASMLAAKNILDSLRMPYYITAGNHETKWSESGATDFAKIFGDDKFTFTHKGCLFTGFVSGPVIKMGDGHIAPQDIDWAVGTLESAPQDMPVFLCTHYPLQEGDVDNWYELTDRVRHFNVQTFLGGHYHRNMVLNYDGICGVLHRSMLRAKDSIGGYSIISVGDSIRFYERKTGMPPVKWLAIPFGKRTYDEPDGTLKPSFAINDRYPNVREAWRIETGAGIYGTPAIYRNKVYFGDDLGNFRCLDLRNGHEKWNIATGSRIISSPAAADGKVVFGSTDGNIYCLSTKDGMEIWKHETGKAVLGMPLISGDTVYIGGSDGCFRALSLNDGHTLWCYEGIGNYIETRPVIYGNKIYFGAWDTNFYALNLSDGSLAWKWNNGNKRMHFSPAAVLPVASEGKIFITAPDRYWTALDAESGREVWRTNRHEVRETIGLSENGKTVFSRCMNDSIVAIDATADTPRVIWKTNAGYGYDHNPSMLIERNGVIIFGTKNGLLHGVDARNGQLLWIHKIGNSLINTIAPISGKTCVISTSEGVVAKIKVQ